MQSPALFSYMSHGYIPKSEKFGLYVPTKRSRVPYPAITKGKENSFISGEVYDIKDISKALRLLDAVEGCPDLYTREVVNVVVNGKTYRAYAYVSVFDPVSMRLEHSTKFKGIKK